MTGGHQGGGGGGEGIVIAMHTRANANNYNVSAHIAAAVVVAPGDSHISFCHAACRRRRWPLTPTRPPLTRRPVQLPVTPGKGKGRGKAGKGVVKEGGVYKMGAVQNVYRTAPGQGCCRESIQKAFHSSVHPSACRPVSREIHFPIM